MLQYSSSTKIFGGNNTQVSSKLRLLDLNNIPLDLGL